jgi:hypothetical protein
LIHVEAEAAAPAVGAHKHSGTFHAKDLRNSLFCYTKVLQYQVIDNSLRVAR